MEFGGNGERPDNDDGDGEGVDLVLLLEELDCDLVVRVAASLALRDSVKHDATRCMESPNGVTTLLSW